MQFANFLAPDTARLASVMTSTSNGLLLCVAATAHTASSNLLRQQGPGGFLFLATNTTPTRKIHTMPPASVNPKKMPFEKYALQVPSSYDRTLAKSHHRQGPIWCSVDSSRWHQASSTRWILNANFGCLKPSSTWDSRKLRSASSASQTDYDFVRQLIEARPDPRRRDHSGGVVQ